MSYQVGYLGALDPSMIIFLLPLVFIPWLLKATGKWHEYRWLLPVIGPLLILFFLAVSLPQVGSGWRLTDGRLRLEAGPVSTLDVTAMRVALVESSSPWRPVARTNGYDAARLSTGWYKLANGKEAVVFRHLRSGKMVVIETGGRYYIISHPGVEKLYAALIARGAAQRAADAREGKGGG